jgi:formiminotetrahydrofolate cyclodeaminase
VLADLSLTDYLARTASGDPLPGGGSSAALNAALAAALTEMVARLTIGRKNFEAVDSEMRAVADQAAALRQKLTRDIDRDSDAYTQVLKAYRLPKSTAPEKAARALAIQDAFRQAALVPLGVARDALQAMTLGRQVIARGNPNAASDGAAGVLAARAAVRTAAYNVKINLGSIQDEAFTAGLRAEADRLEAEADAREREILQLMKL